MISDDHKIKEKKLREKNLVIITATICPPDGITNTTLINCDERIRQYIHALEKIISCKYIHEIVFVDNSNYIFDNENLIKQAQDNNKKIEFLKYKADDFWVKQHGKGAGELDIINFALKNSILLKDKKYFFKLTGRIVVENIDRILKHTQKKKNYFQYNLQYRNRKKINYVETVFYKINISDFVSLGDMRSLIFDSENIFLEHVMYDQMKKNNIKYSYFPVYPIITGVSGSTGEKYNESKRKIIIKSIFTFTHSMKILLYIKKFMGRDS